MKIPWAQGVKEQANSVGEGKRVCFMVLDASAMPLPECEAEELSLALEEEARRSLGGDVLFLTGDYADGPFGRVLIIYFGRAGDGKEAISAD